MRACDSERSGHGHEGIWKKVKAFCQEKIDSYKVPVKIVITAERQHTARFKKIGG